MMHSKCHHFPNTDGIERLTPEKVVQDVYDGVKRLFGIAFPEYWREEMLNAATNDQLSFTYLGRSNYQKDEKGIEYNCTLKMRDRTITFLFLELTGNGTH